MKKLLIATALAASFGLAQADAIKSYKSNTYRHHLICTLSLMNDQMSRELGEKSTGQLAQCVTVGAELAKKQYAEAAKQVEGKPAAVAALKEHLIKVLAQLNGLEPALGERKISYEQRQARLEGATQEAWGRFEVESL
jgi:hypothetical protein